MNDVKKLADDLYKTIKEQGEMIDVAIGIEGNSHILEGIQRYNKVIGLDCEFLLNAIERAKEQD